MAEPWKLNGPGHTASTELCCCDNENCRPYFPCCIRQTSAGFHALVAEQDPLDPGNPDAGAFAEARVSRFTLENLCNAQESADWSWFQLIDGDDDVVFSGRLFQGCTFGIDISLEDLFCDCVTEGYPNFRWTAVICNPNDFAIWLTVTRPEFCISFNPLAADNFCCLDQIGPQQFGPVLVPAGGEYTITVEFKKADWNLCTGECYRNGPPAILMGPTYLDDNLDHTCLRPISCVGEIREFPFDGNEIPNCDYEECPECGCRLDLDCEFSECCGCGCDGVEAMNSCAPPKELCAGCTADNGSVTICYDTNQGLAVGGAFVMCVNDDCKVTAEVRRNIPAGSWTFVRFGDPPGTGVSVTIPEATTGTFNCQDVTITWDISGGFATLTVDGHTNSTPLPTPYTPIVPSGQCYVVARGGQTFTLK